MLGASRFKTFHINKIGKSLVPSALYKRLLHNKYVLLEISKFRSCNDVTLVRVLLNKILYSSELIEPFELIVTVFFKLTLVVLSSPAKTT